MDGNLVQCRVVDPSEDPQLGLLLMSLSFGNLPVPGGGRFYSDMHPVLVGSEFARIDWKSIDASELQGIVFGSA